MTILKILQHPDVRLRRKGIPVTDFGEKIQTIIDDMFETHYAQTDCAALAATQLDLADAPHITVIDLSEAQNQPLCLVNARITEKTGETYESEACMSVMNNGSFLFEKVKRAERIVVEAQDRFGKPMTIEADDFLAKCIQHELDHLEGILFIDHLSPIKRKRLFEKTKK